MSENQSLPVSSDASEQSASPRLESQAKGQSEGWQTVPMPGTVDSVQFSTGHILPERERELLSLIHDLNQCNDTLLSRVTQLEAALEAAQSSQQLSHQKSSLEGAQQQIAKLVGELDNAEQALSRQTLVNENLQTEVNNHQERISQLERECTIVAQQHLEEVQARAKAEAASRDLRSRLQRQQRYTMQFKAALEKSLTVTAKPTNTAAIQPVASNDPAAVTMPKAQRIMPWVSNNASPFAGIDPHLESLIRGVGKSGNQANSQASQPDTSSEQKAKPESNLETGAANNRTTTSANEPTAEVIVEANTDFGAKTKLWKDIERVISHSTAEDGSDKDAAAKNKDVKIEETKIEETKIENVEAKASNKASSNARSHSQEDTSKNVVDKVTPVSSKEPQVQPKGNTQKLEVELEKSASDKDSLEKVSLEKDDLIHQIERSFAATSRSVQEETVAFTEPSPWGAPLAEKSSDKKLEKVAAGLSSNDLGENYLPVFDSKVDAAISPLVKPLKPQKKSSSLSDIELPTFQNAKVASFRS